MSDQVENLESITSLAKLAEETLLKLGSKEYIGARESDRRFSKLWFTGKIKAQDGQKAWAYVAVHAGLCSAAFDSLRSEGVDCTPKFDNPHISFIRKDEVAKLKKKFGDKWRGAVKEGQSVRFHLLRMVHLIPKGWDDVDRVWFLEVESPELRKIRAGLGLTELPQSDDGKQDLRFHITFAVRKTMAKAAEELVTDLQKATNGDEMLPLTNTSTKQGVKLQEVFSKMELDPNVTMRTLGSEYKTVSPEVLLRTSQKLLNINKGNESTDDRDSLAFQVVHGPEDFFAERISKDAGQVARKLLWKATLRGNLNHVPSGALTPQLRSVLLGSGMAMPLEEINPFDAYDQSQRVIRLGEGGIPSLEAVPDEARNVQNSHLGFLDPIRSPECYDEQTEVMTLTGWKRWPNVTAEDQLACLVEGRLEFHRPSRLIAEPYKGLMYGATTEFLDYLVTPNHRLWVRPQSNKQKKYSPLYRFELPGEVCHAQRLFCCGGHVPIPGELASFTLPLTEAEGKERQIQGNPPIGASLKLYKEPIDIHDWAEFLGWYLSEGSLNGKYVTRISQSKAVNPENCLQIERLLNRLPFAWCFVDGDTFNISSKQLRDHLQQFGFCNDKFIPTEIFAAPVAARQLFLDAMLRGDGRKDLDGTPRTLCTTSSRLAEDFQRLAFQLGYSTRVSFEPDERKETYLGCYTVRLHQANERLIVHRSPRHPNGQYSVVEYEGTVYCATVPGGLLYVRRNSSVGFWCGNSAKMGVDSRVSHRVMRGSDGRFYAPMRDLRKGGEKMVSAEEASDSIIAFPGEMASDRKKVRAMVQSKKVSYVDRDKVDFELASPTQIFSLSVNLIPMISAIKGGRALMGGKYPTQALPLNNPEAPLVRSATGDGRTFVGILGERMGAVRADVGGAVEKVTNDEIVIRTPEGRKSYDLFHNFPYNRKTYNHNTPLVKIGDVVKPGQLLASSNYTDSEGNMAIGKNLRTAYISYRGLNYEDGSVVSETAAKRLASEHMYQHPLSPEEGIEIGRKGFVSLYPAQFNATQLKTIDEKGVVKPGTRVKKGDPLILAVQRTIPTKLSRSHKPMFVNSAVTWDHDVEGVVTDADETKDGGYNVAVKAYTPLQEGDKLAGFYGDKGVVSKVVPDDRMPRDSEGRPFEVLLNPMGVMARNNAAQVYEALLGKVAEKSGKPVEVPGFTEGSMLDYIKEQLSKHQLKDTDTIEDPETGRRIPGVLTGSRYLMKLHHTAESKGAGRDIGAYTAEGIPAKGGEASSKRIGSMETNALISHGATEVLKDAKIIRGQRNDDFWRAFRLGYPPPSPKIPFVYEKFMASLNAAGVNTKKDGNRIHLFALTDKDVNELSAGAVQNADTVEGDDFKPVKGGLFDESLTGGAGGNRWAHIALAEPMPNPVMEEPIRRLLGLTKKDYRAVISGEKELWGTTGGEAVRRGLGKIDVDNALKQYEGILRHGPRSKRDDAAKALGYLRTVKDHGINMQDWVMTKWPVLPPSMRPITVMREMQMVADPNYLYRDLFHANKDLDEIKGVVGEKKATEERLRIYDGMRAISGLGDPIQPKTQEKGVKGLLGHVFGGTPKAGMYQRRVLNSSVDVVGRATITPNPELGMDQVGLPEPKAWTIYRPFIVRNLVRRGLPAGQAAIEVANQSPTARNALMDEIGKRPVIINRAPTLHRYGFMAAWPVLTKGETLQLPPPIVTGFNADFDGDAMNYHVPVSDEAVKDAVEKMMPSRNLKSVRDFKVHYLPRHEFMMGLYLASRPNREGRTRVFRSKEDVVAAYQRGDIGLKDKIVIGSVKK